MSVLHVDGKITPIAFEQIDGMVAATGLTSGTFGNATMALIQAEDQNVRWRDDPGGDPTTSVGVQLQAGSDFWYTGDLATIKFIQETATAKLNVSYYQV